MPIFPIYQTLTSPPSVQLAQIAVRKMTPTEISQQMKTLPGWTVEGQILSRTFVFKNFIEAIAFVNRLVEPAEAAGHHPDLYISYKRVTVNLTTHDVGGLTQKDFALARKISSLPLP